MSELLTNISNHSTHIFPCDCHDWHFIEVELDDIDANWNYLNIVDTYWPRRIIDRFKAAFRVLRGKPHYHSSVILNEQNMDSLLELLSSRCKVVPVSEQVYDQDADNS